MASLLTKAGIEFTFDINVDGRTKAGKALKEIKGYLEDNLEEIEKSDKAFDEINSTLVTMKKHLQTARAENEKLSDDARQNLSVWEDGIDDIRSAYKKNYSEIIKQDEKTTKEAIKNIKEVEATETKRVKNKIKQLLKIDAEEKKSAQNYENWWTSALNKEEKEREKMIAQAWKDNEKFDKQREKDHQDQLKRIEQEEQARKDAISAFSSTLSDVGGKISSLGQTLTLALTTPFILGAKQAGSFALDFDQAFNRISAITGIGRSVEDMQALEDMATDLGRTTSRTGAEIATGMQTLALAGKDVNEIMGLMPSIVNLAEAEMMDVGVASDYVVGILNQFKLGTEDAEGALDVLAKASTSSNMTIASLAEGLKFVGPSAKQAGFTLEEMSAMMGIMADNGLKAGIAGRALRMALIRMQSPTDASMAEFAELNEEIMGMVDEGTEMESILLELTGALDGMSTTSKSAMLQTMFGTRAMTQMSTVVGDNVGSYSELLDELENADGALEEMRGTILDKDSLYGAWALLTSSIQEAGRVLFSANNGPIVKFLQKAKEWVDVLIEMDDEQRKQIVNNLLFVAGLGPVLILIGKFIGLVGTLSSVMATAGASTALLSAGLWAIPVALIGVGIWKLIDTLGVFKDDMSNVGEDFKGLSSTLESNMPTMDEEFDVINGNFEDLMFAMNTSSEETGQEIAKNLSQVGAQLAGQAEAMVSTFLDSVQGDESLGAIERSAYSDYALKQMQRIQEIKKEINELDSEDENYLENLTSLRQELVDIENDLLTTKDDIGRISRGEIEVVEQELTMLDKVLKARGDIKSNEQELLDLQDKYALAVQETTNPYIKGEFQKGLDFVTQELQKQEDLETQRNDLYQDYLDAQRKLEAMKLNGNHTNEELIAQEKVIRDLGWELADTMESVENSMEVIDALKFSNKSFDVIINEYRNVTTNYRTTGLGERTNVGGGGYQTGPFSELKWGGLTESEDNLTSSFGGVMGALGNIIQSGFGLLSMPSMFSSGSNYYNTVGATTSNSNANSTSTVDQSIGEVNYNINATGMTPAQVEQIMRRDARRNARKVERKRG